MAAGTFFFKSTSPKVVAVEEFVLPILKIGQGFLTETSSQAQCSRSLSLLWAPPYPSPVKLASHLLKIDAQALFDSSSFFF
jgi:hypothetical protein